LDEELIESKIDIINRNLNYLRETSKLDFEEFEKFEKIQAIKRSLQESIEACCDIGQYIIAEKEFEKPESYSEIFKILKEEEIIEKELAQNLIKMAKFRNLLVHQYGEIDKKKVYEIVNQNLENIEKFLKTTSEFMEE